MSMSLTKAVLSKYPNPVFIETGTGEGGGVALARDCGFERIITIDPNEQSLARARQMVAACETILGDSRVKLAELLFTIKTPATFFLDAHNHYTGQAPVCCALEELKAIGDWWRDGSVVLVDDFRMFGGWEFTGSWAALVSQSQLLWAVRNLVRKHGGRVWFEDAKQDRQDILAYGAMPK